MDTFIEDKNKNINFHIFFLSFIALKKCTNLQDLWHPLNEPEIRELLINLFQGL